MAFKFVFFVALSSLTHSLTHSFTTVKCTTTLQNGHMIFLNVMYTNVTLLQKKTLQNIWDKL